MGICSRIREVGNKYGKMDLMIQKGYVQMKECPRNESFADNRTKEERNWNVGGCEIGEVGEYKYLGVTVKAGLNGGFKSMGDRMVDANGPWGQE